LGLFANIRPVKIYPALADASTLKREVVEKVDLVIVRELTGGLYFGQPQGRQDNDQGRAAVDTMYYTEAEIGRLMRISFDLARQRRKKITSVDKANVLASSRLWREVAHEVAAEYPDVEYEDILVDACSMYLIRRPADFDVIATENMFGDILSDEASMLAGSMGMLPSASLGETKTNSRLRAGYCRPGHRQPSGNHSERGHVVTHFVGPVSRGWRGRSCRRCGAGRRASFAGFDRAGTAGYRHQGDGRFGR
jgi:3-isopropylmalate dehydrogenase